MIVVVQPRERYREIIDISEEGIIFKVIRRKTLYEWEKIIHIFRWTRFNMLTVVDDEGNVSTGNVFPDKSFRKASEKVKYIWNVWRNRIIDARQINSFEYSQWCRQKELQLTLQNFILGFGVGLCFMGLGIYIFLTEDWRNWKEFESYFAPVGGILFGLFALWFGIYNLLKRIRKKITTMSFDADDIQVLYDNGSVDIFNIRNIKKYLLENPRNIGTLIFENGTKLQHLDRMSYWPVLRERLLSRLEPSEENKDK